MTREDIKKYLKENLRLDVVTTSEYCMPTADGEIYRDCHTLKLILDGEVIDEVYLS